jgi:hypothetical protein
VLYSLLHDAAFHVVEFLVPATVDLDDHKPHAASVKTPQLLVVMRFLTHTV